MTYIFYCEKKGRRVAITRDKPNRFTLELFINSLEIEGYHVEVVIKNNAVYETGKGFTK